MQRARRLDDVAQDAIDAKADDRARFIRLEVKIGRALAQRLQQQRVDHADDRRLRACVKQIFRRRQVLQQSREIALVRGVIAPCQRAALVVGARELGGKRFGGDGACQQRPVENTLDFGNAVDRRIGAQQNNDGLAVISIREHAMHLRECVRNASDERRIERSSYGGGDIHRCVDDEFGTGYFAAGAGLGATPGPGGSGTATPCIAGSGASSGDVVSGQNQRGCG